MSIELLFKIADTLETDPNTILGVKNNVASVDEALNELPFSGMQNLKSRKKQLRNRRIYTTI